MKKILITIGVIIAVIAISYGVSVLLTALGMWALTKAGILAAWTWKQAALVAIVVMLVLSLTSKTTTVKVKH